MKNKTIPTKISFSGKDYDDWKIHSADFKPFEYQEDFAEDMNRIACIVSDAKNAGYSEAYKALLIEALEKAKSFACSTIIPDGTGFSRVFFDTPEDLKSFIENYQETK
jgi:hypothetical protein